LKTQFIFNLDEKEAADTLGIVIDTIRNWRNNGTLPDYLYRRFGPPAQLRIRYCLTLLLRWQAVGGDEVERQKEEAWARGELIKSLQISGRK
jgi:hypothetical protein